ncbi:Flp pilus assembly complex ATPase component TadA [Pseudomonas sp. WS 5532]|uniref:GspE/PulE family protein n=1 Tax=Pseudomonas sp. WS 5532 TaxID=2717495 RepID=UPI00147556F3|nr:ATPase, T2SS/T4P/T4SS family [Pseudomonas sp. WS 5532]NMX77863.1 Flp pilus assembly complex ATPase component TadA [Pseudomonas sp. WS 5532]
MGVALASANIELTREVLTGPGGKFQVEEKLRDLLCLTDDYVLHVSGSHMADHFVLGFMERLSKAKVRFTIQKRPLSEIRDLYQAQPQRVATFSGSKTAGLLEDATPRQTEVMRLVKDAIDRGTSDIHLIIDHVRHEALIEFRINGDLVVKDRIRAEDGQAIASTIYQSMCDVADPTYNELQPQDARLKQSFVKKWGLYGARIATRPTDTGSLMVMRLLRSSSGKTLEDLGYLPEQIRLLTRMIQRRKGIIFISGPTGSGKSSTLQCALDDLLEVFEYKIRLLTIENPPEYQIGKGRAVQTPILCDSDDPVALSAEWARSISNAMRLDPDVMMVGEIRDLASALAAFTASMTGHQLWTSIHTNDLIQIIDRLRELGVTLSLLTDPMLMTGLINQELVKTLCDHCKVPFDSVRDRYTEDLVERVEKFCKPEQVFGCGPGCSHCNYTGVANRTVVAEVMMPTKAFMKQYRDKDKAEARVYWVKEMGGITKNDHLVRLINQGRVDPLHGEREVCTLDEDEITLGD